ncbi:MAG: helix-turn-helix transcriptional regulator [Lachnospiraceae bacterium]|nr:helix-turn-helix transcriptional regulator [Lachnospiraceae bacterium]
MNQIKNGQFLKELRKEKGLTQEQFAEKFNLSRRTVSRWENGNNMPDLDILLALAEFYAVDIREIMDGERKSGTMNTEQQEMFAKLTDYSKCKEQLLLRKVIAIVTIGIIAWAVSFAFLLMFMNSATEAGLLLILEAVMLLLYGVGMLCVKMNRSITGFLNSVLGAAIALVISNIILAVIFFGTGSYYNHGIVGVYYALLSLLVVFGIIGVVMTVISKKEQKEMK